MFKTSDPAKMNCNSHDWVTTYKLYCLRFWLIIIESKQVNQFSQDKRVSAKLNRINIIIKRDVSITKSAKTKRMLQQDPVQIENQTTLKSET